MEFKDVRKLRAILSERGRKNRDTGAVSKWITVQMLGYSESFNFADVPELFDQLPEAGQMVDLELSIQKQQGKTEAYYRFTPTRVSSATSAAPASSDATDGLGLRRRAA